MTGTGTDSPPHRIRPVPFDDDEGVQAIAELHMELLHFGPIAALGERFIREICYRKEAEEGVLHLALFEVEGEPAGCLAYTSLPYVFHQSIMHKHWFRASWMALLSLLEKPSRIAKLPRVFSTIKARIDESHKIDPELGEIVCVAVRPKYLKPAVTKKIGRRIPEELLRYAAHQLFEHHQVRRLRMIVDADNKHALFMYHRLGGQFEKLVWAGEAKTDVYFDLSEDAPIMGAAE